MPLCGHCGFNQSVKQQKTHASVHKCINVVLNDYKCSQKYLGNEFAFKRQTKLWRVKACWAENALQFQTNKMEKKPGGTFMIVQNFIGVESYFDKVRRQANFSLFYRHWMHIYVPIVLASNSSSGCGITLNANLFIHTTSSIASLVRSCLRCHSIILALSPFCLLFNTLF